MFSRNEAMFKSLLKLKTFISSVFFSKAGENKKNIVIRSEMFEGVLKIAFSSSVYYPEDRKCIMKMSLESCK